MEKKKLRQNEVNIHSQEELEMLVILKITATYQAIQCSFTKQENSIDCVHIYNQLQWEGKIMLLVQNRLLLISIEMDGGGCRSIWQKDASQTNCFNSGDKWTTLTCRSII